MATYLVTGGCGFIGSHLVEALLQAGHAVRILDNLSTGRLENKPAAAELLQGDVADPRVVAEAMRGAEGCFHLAAVASVERGNLDWLGTHRTNLTGSITVFDAARRANPRGPVRVVYASSAAVYGDNPTPPLAETATPRPLSAYGADKLGSEQHGFVAGWVHGVPTCGLRFFNIYGPRQDPKSPYSGVISIFCDRLRAGQGITIFGDGRQSRDFVFVGDAVRALLAAMSRASTAGRAYNVCTGRSTTIRDLADMIGRILGRRAEITFGPPRAGEIRVSLGDPTAARRDLGFEAQTWLEDGLVQTLASLEPTVAGPAIQPKRSPAGPSAEPDMPLTR
ncbi:MAG: NAD-dependent epimerase/dehydratase family protein [Acetobacteraceae bacterium]|nr:NAD-dependent epimerase/dehydratase family protein [Acetobacteraceae bacterium]